MLGAHFPNLIDLYECRDFVPMEQAPLSPFLSSYVRRNTCFGKRL